MIIRGGALRFAGYLATVALSVLPVAVLTRYLGVVSFGRYTTVISLVTVVQVVTDVGMSTFGTREYAVRHGADRDAFMRNLLGLRVALTLAGVVFATVFAALAGYGAALLAGTVLASLATVALVFQHTLTIPLAAELRLGMVALLDLARQAVTVVAILLLVAAGAGLFPLLAVSLLTYLLLVPVTARLVRGQIGLNMNLHPRRWLALLRLTVSFSLASAVGALYAYTAQILTSLVASPHQSGLFAVSFRVFLVGTTVPGLLVSGALPLLARAAHDDRERLAYAIQRIFEVSLILGVAAAIGLLAGAPFLIEVVAGPRYAAAAPVLRIEGAAMVASFLVATWGYALVSLNRYRGLLLVNAVALVVSCLVTLSLAAAHGAQGAAIAVLCGEFTLALGYLLVLARRSPDLRPELRIVPKVALAAALAVLAAVLPALPSLALTVIALAVYGSLIALTRAIPSEMRELVPLRRFRPHRPASP
jgi:O-antigen/teichoic acid export membrane protein